MGMDGMDQEGETCCQILLALVLCPPLGIVLAVGCRKTDSEPQSAAAVSVSVSIAPQAPRFDSGGRER